MIDSEPRPLNRRVSPGPAPEPAAPPAAAEAASAFGTRERARRRRRLWASLALVLVVGALVGLWFGLPVRTVTVSGHARLSEARVRDLAGLTPGFSWAYYGAWRARGLEESPWVQSAQVTRRFPDTVAISVTERVPFARWRRPDGEVLAVAEDGTVLPGAGNVARLPLLGGWGPDRLEDALFVARSLGRYNVQSVAYTPSGVTAKTAGGTVWSGDLDTLLNYAGALTQFPGKRIHIYPWGVSVQK
ncbi:cell division protein FtsQ/DivIB [Deinococcus planocerae]|uniref:cell division protein FtsQ/DivIB n=1 Tax=Deinococcus planocerae TaxID=1737569 RepID=UPI000C7EC0F9|nr:FtsQ-type POTRA domain-containing protein [Deinococcus planocerae]